MGPPLNIYPIKYNGSKVSCYCEAKQCEIYPAEKEVQYWKREKNYDKNESERDLKGEVRFVEQEDTRQDNMANLLQ